MDIRLVTHIVMKKLLRKLFYLSPLARQIIGWISVSLGRTSPLGVAHLSTYNDKKAIGPLQQPEALLLFSIVKTVIPKTILEFGFYHGHSAFNFLQAMSPDARLFSYDVSEESLAIATTEFPRDPRFSFLHKSQTDFSPCDIENRRADLVFFDASHSLTINQETFTSVYPSLSESSLVCIHDTGLWNKNCLSDIHRNFIQQQHSKDWVDEENYAHQNGERLFVNWILDTYPTFQSVHFHSSLALRHGLTILQQQRKLSTPPETLPHR